MARTLFELVTFASGRLCCILDGVHYGLGNG